jgi:uncharacterized protein YjbI with pentapeptide repeats
MNESSRAVLEAETPVNPYSLLDAVNRSCAAARTAWLVLLAVMAYLLITVAAITHEDLLLDRGVTLPILQVRIALEPFFVAAPLLLVAVHVAVLGQVVVLARKTSAFADAIRMLEIGEEHSHPLRLELDNFFFVQAMAGPQRSRLIGALQHGVGWVSLVLLPVLLLLYIEAHFLPYHDPGITWTHRAAILTDVGFLFAAGVFVLGGHTSFWHALWGCGREHPAAVLSTAALVLIALHFATFIATVPGETLERVAWAPLASASSLAAEGGSVAWLRRNLEVTDRDLTGDAGAPGRSTLNLRGRDLRHARLDRSRLQHADLRGADLAGASLIAADLRGALLECVGLDALLLESNRRAAGCVDAHNADFSKARLSQARLAGIDARAATFDAATLDDAELSYGNLAGASFAGAGLERANLTGGVELEGSNFLLASLEGADIAGAKLAGADLTGASLKGANLSLAGLEGSVLRGAALEGANLQRARLYGADLAGAKLQGADLSGVAIWRTVPPASEALLLSDLAQVSVRAPEEGELAALRGAGDVLEGIAARTRVAAILTSLLDAKLNAGWAAAPEREAWFGLVKSETAAPDYRLRLTDQLANLACRTREGAANGAVATGITRRALAEGFKGDVAALAEKLKSPTCPAAAGLAPRLARQLSDAALGLARP